MVAGLRKKEWSLHILHPISCMLLLIACNFSTIATNVRQEGSRWIVITTNKYPTEIISKLANVSGWNVVVIADEESPSDWSLDNVHYLDIDSQARLGYHILPSIPDNHFGCVLQVFAVNIPNKMRKLHIISADRIVLECTGGRT